MSGVNPLIPIVGGLHGLYAANKMLQRYDHYRDRIEQEQSYKRARSDAPARATPAADNMVSRSRTRTAVRRRTKRTRRGRLRRVQRAVSLWPASRLVKLRLVKAFTSTPDGAGQIKTHTLFFNTLNDPTSGMGDGLPLGLDQWAALYRRYCVVGARVFVKVHNVTSTGAVAYGLTAYEPGNTTAPASHEEAMELPHTRSRILSPDMDHSGLGLSWSAKRAFKVKNLKDASELHGELSLTPTSPTKTARLYLWSQDVNSTETHTIEGFLTMEFIVLLMDRINPTRSSLV